MLDILLDKKQLLAYNSFKNGYNLFITGGAGSGKSFLIESFKNYINKETNKIITITSTTGISALNIDGITIHSWAGIEANTNFENIDNFVKKIINNYNKLNNYLFTDVLIIDEISMLDSETLDFINIALKIIRNNVEPFGGIQLIMLGDFAQLPPVNSNNFAFKCKCWNEIIDYTILLKKIYRQNENEMTKFLSFIRNGVVNNFVLDIVEKCSTIDEDNNLTHLYPNRFNVNVKNLVELEKLDGKTIELVANIISNKEDSIDFPDNLNVKEIITLKQNAFIMLTKNIDIEQKLVNGTQGYFKGITDNNKLIFENNNGTYQISKYLWEFDNYSIEQFPVCLAWAITIHKSQGMGIDNLSVDIGNNIFEDGQTYVALSRSKSLKGLHIKNFSKKSVRSNSDIIKFYNDLDVISKNWFRDEDVFINQLDGRRVLNIQKIPENSIIIDNVDEEPINTAINNCNYSNYDIKCFICDSFGCRNDLLIWFNEKICTECVIKNKDFKQICKTDIYKLFNNHSKKFINDKLKIAPCKIIVNRNRFRTKTKIYLIKNLKSIFVESVKKPVEKKENLEINIENNIVESVKKPKQKKENLKINIENNIDNIDLYNKLKNYRNAQAKKLKIPTYCIFPNKTIEELTKTKILSLEDLMLISGIGKNKIEKYGEDILKIIN